MSWNWVICSWFQFHNVEDWVEACHGFWELESVGILTHPPLYDIRSKELVGKFWRWLGGSDVTGIQVHSVSYSIFWSRSSLLILISCHVFFPFARAVLASSKDCLIQSVNSATVSISDWVCCGSNPIQGCRPESNMNGVWCGVECMWLLYCNSARGRSSFQSSCLSLTKSWRYCSNSW